MKLTNEQIEQILKEAPQGAIEYCLYDYGDATHPLFLNCENQFYEEEWVDMRLVDNYFHSRRRLSDLREILTLRQRVQREPVGRVKTVGGYPDESEHTVEWLCKYKDLKDGDLLHTTPQPAEQPIRHDWDDQDKCRRCGGRNWWTSATCTPKQPAPDVDVDELLNSFPLFDEDGLDPDIHHCEWHILQERKRLHSVIAKFRSQGGEL